MRPTAKSPRCPGAALARAARWLACLLAAHPLRRPAVGGPGDWEGGGGTRAPPLLSLPSRNGGEVSGAQAIQIRRGPLLAAQTGRREPARRPGEAPHARLPPGRPGPPYRVAAAERGAFGQAGLGLRSALHLLHDALDVASGDPVEEHGWGAERTRLVFCAAPHYFHTQLPGALSSSE